MPTALARPWPSGPVVVSTPGVTPYSGMAGRLRVQLPEALQLVHRQVVAGQMQQRVQQHRAVAVGDDEAVAIRPLRMRGIVAQVPVPQRDRDFGHAHRHARVAALRGFDRIHRQGADGVGEQGIGDGGGGGHGGGDSQIEVGGRAAGATGPRCRHGDPNPRRVSSNDERRTIRNYRVRVPIAQRFPYPLPATAGVRRVAAVLCGRTGRFDRRARACPRTAVVHHCGKRPPVNGSVRPGDWTAPPAAAMATQGLERGAGRPHLRFHGLVVGPVLAYPNCRGRRPSRDQAHRCHARRRFRPHRRGRVRNRVPARPR